MTARSVEGVAWEHLAVLLAVLRHGSLNRAAQALRIGQSTASRRLARLEERLGARLFDRLPEGLRPTQFAIDLEPHARFIEGHMADVERLAAGQEAAPHGRVVVALPDGLASHWLIPMLPDFYARYPQVEVDCVIGHAVVDLTRRAADLALRFVPPTAPDLVVRRLRTIPLAAYVHPRLADADPAALRWIMLGDPERRFVESRWIDAHVAPGKTMNVSLWHALLAAVQQGLGAGILSPLVAEPLGLTLLEIDDATPLSRELLLVYHRALRDVPRIAALRRWLVEVAPRAPVQPGPG